MSPSPSHGVSVQGLEQVYEDWGISVVKKELRHRFEGAFEKRNVLELRLWKEDKSLRSGVPPSPVVFCEMAHRLIYGSSRNRKASGRIPLKEFFGSNPQVDAVRLTYFLVSFKNLPEPPQQNEGLRPQKSKIRVTWKREESVLPYISYEINRKEWALIAKSIYGNSNTTKFQFAVNECEGVLNIAGRFQTDFEPIKLLDPGKMGR